MAGESGWREDRKCLQGNMLGAEVSLWTTWSAEAHF